MSVVFGHCTKCPAKSPVKRLYGSIEQRGKESWGLCSYHLAHPGDDNSRQTIKADAVEIHEKELLRKFFAEQVRIMPARCENCGKRITTPGAPRSAAVAHIIPKRHFKSVMVHPMNRWFGCGDCHTNYDNKGWTYAVTMPVWPTCVERFREFMALIKDTELKFLPDALVIVMQDSVK
jgi:hypothetical protein